MRRFAQKQTSKSEVKVMPEWQPIETAPTNGARIWAWTTEWLEPMSVRYSWRGWTPGYDLGPLKHQPTHWLPTPDPPYSEDFLKIRRWARGEAEV